MRRHLARFFIISLRADFCLDANLTLRNLGNGPAKHQCRKGQAELAHGMSHACHPANISNCAGSLCGERVWAKPMACRRLRGTQKSVAHDGEVKEQEMSADPAGRSGCAWQPCRLTQARKFALKQNLSGRHQQVCGGDGGSLLQRPCVRWKSEAWHTYTGIANGWSKTDKEMPVATIPTEDGLCWLPLTAGSSSWCQDWRSKPIQEDHCHWQAGCNCLQ